MYLITWIDNGEEKTFVAEGWIERDSEISLLVAEGFDPVFELI